MSTKPCTHQLSEDLRITSVQILASTQFHKYNQQSFIINTILKAVYDYTFMLICLYLNNAK